MALIKGATLAYRDFRGRTLLHQAVESWSDGAEPAFAWLLECGLDSRALDSGGNTLLHTLADHSRVPDGLWDRLLPFWITSSRTIRVALLYTSFTVSCREESHGSLPMIQDQHERDYLREKEKFFPMYLASTQRSKMVEMLLEYGADPFALLSYKRMFGDFRYGYRAIAPNAAPDIPEGYIETRILHQVIKENTFTLPSFLNAITKIDIDRRDPQGNTLLLFACASDKGADDQVEITSLPGSQEQERLSTSSRKRSILRYLLSRGADPLATDNQGRNALHHMIDNHIENRDSENKYTDSLEHMATTYPTLVNERDILGRMPLHLALRLVLSIYENLEVAYLLLEAGADPLLVDNEGNSCLHIISHKSYNWLSCSDKRRELFRDLLRRGCEIDGRNIRGGNSVVRLQILEK